MRYLTNYNFDLKLFTISRKTRRNIFPVGLFGIASTNLTPPCSRFGFDKRSEMEHCFLLMAVREYFRQHFHGLPATNRITSFSVIVEPGCLTTNANAVSPLSSFGTPITPASLICGFVKRSASISAGGT